MQQDTEEALEETLEETESDRCAPSGTAIVGQDRTGSVYDILDAFHGDRDGPSHRRWATVAEVVRGHGPVLADLAARPGRWHLFIEVDIVLCPSCGGNGGRYLQFAVLEDGVSMVGECSANVFLDEHVRLDAAQEAALARLGWRAPTARVPNWHHEATTEADRGELARMTGATLTEVFGLAPDDRVEVRICERILGR